MALYLQNRTVIKPTASNPLLPEPAGAVDGELQFVIVGGTSGIQGLDESWIEVPIPQLGRVRAQLFWGIRGVHFTGGNAQVDGSTGVFSTIIQRYRVTGIVDSSSEIPWIRTFFDDDVNVFECDPLSLAPYPQRSRINFAFAAQNAGSSWSSFTGGNGLPNSLHYADAHQQGSGASVLVGLAYAEDNAAAQGQVGGNIFRSASAPGGQRDCVTLNFSILGATPPQTDVLSPALVL